MIMENIIKGWLLSAIGLLGIVVTILHATGVYELPNPEILDSTWEVTIALIVCFSLFLLPKTKIEKAVESLFSTIVNLFKKKYDNGSSNNNTR